jgi:hypothetical protein
MGILSPRGEEEVCKESSKGISTAIKGNFPLAPWGSRRLSISEYVSEDAHRAGEGPLNYISYVSRTTQNSSAGSRYEGADESHL